MLVPDPLLLRQSCKLSHGLSTCPVCSRAPLRRLWLRVCLKQVPGMLNTYAHATQPHAACATLLPPPHAAELLKPIAARLGSSPPPSTPPSSLPARMPPPSPEPHTMPHSTPPSTPPTSLPARMPPPSPEPHTMPHSTPPAAAVQQLHCESKREPLGVRRRQLPPTRRSHKKCQTAVLGGLPKRTPSGACLCSTASCTRPTYTELTMTVKVQGGILPVTSFHGALHQKPCIYHAHASP